MKTKHLLSFFLSLSARCHHYMKLLTSVLSFWVFQIPTLVHTSEQISEEFMITTINFKKLPSTLRAQEVMQHDTETSKSEHVCVNIESIFSWLTLRAFSALLLVKTNDSLVCFWTASRTRERAWYLLYIKSSQAWFTNLWKWFTQYCVCNVHFNYRLLNWILPSLLVIWDRLPERDKVE